MKYLVCEIDSNEMERRAAAFRFSVPLEAWKNRKGSPAFVVKTLR